MTSKKPNLVYGSKQYKSMLYARMMRDNGFTAESLANCLSGIHEPEKYKTKHATSSIETLLKKGFIERVSISRFATYAITSEGIIAIIESSSEHQRRLSREIGSKFTKLAKESLTLTSNIGNPIDSAVLDAEDKVLDEMYMRYKKRQEKKSSNSKKG